MARLKLYYTDGQASEFGIERLDRLEVDQFLEDVATTGGGFLVTDEGPLAIPAGGHGIRAVRVVVDGEEWLAGREDEELTDDQLD